MERVSGNPIEGNQSPKGIFEDNMVEWGDVQSLLSNMGIQLFRDTSTTSSVGNVTNAKKNRGKRELQSLNFHLNYDRGSCGRGNNTTS